MRRFWLENENILRGFRDWLTQTEREIDALPDSGHYGQDSPATNGELREPPGDAGEPPQAGILQVVEALTAMRHELKLQTKSARGLEDHVESTLQGLRAAIEQFESAPDREQELVESASESAGKAAAVPLIEALLGFDEAVLRAMQAVEATHRRITESAPRQLRELIQDEMRQVSWWRRWGGLRTGWENRLVEQVTRNNAEEFAGLIEGFGLLHERMERILQEQNIHRIKCVGQRVDPTKMTVIGVRSDENAEPQTVIEQVRPGYIWRGNVIRFAEVIAVKKELRVES